MEAGLGGISITYSNGRAGAIGARLTKISNHSVLELTLDNRRSRITSNIECLAYLTKYTDIKKPHYFEDDYLRQNYCTGTIPIMVLFCLGFSEINRYVVGHSIFPGCSFQTLMFRG